MSDKSQGAAECYECWYPMTRGGYLPVVMPPQTDGFGSSVPVNYCINQACARYGLLTVVSKFTK